MKKHLLILIRTPLLILLDQISKYLFYDQNYLNNLNIIQPAFNTWISRSLPIPQLITMILTIIIIAFVIYYYQKNKISKREIIFIIWWAIGNLIDRIFLGWVRDFISVWNRFPIFNIADILINIGLIFVVLKEFFGIWQKYSWKTKNY
jgi:signal peptidase II